MRILAGILILSSALLHIILGSLNIMSSKLEEFKALDNAGDLSSVSKDLGVSEAEQNKMHEAAKAKIGAAGVRPLVFAIILLAMALLQILSAILLLIRKARPLTLGVMGVSVAALIGILIVNGFDKLYCLMVILLILALIFSVLARSARAARIA
jgi:hypothetical protein